jgi:hypothetical protein
VAPTPLTITIPAASHVRVWLCGGGPGLNFELATFSFQVPTKGLLCANNTLPAASTIAKTANNPIRRFIERPPQLDFRNSDRI